MAAHAKLGGSDRLHMRSLEEATEEHSGENAREVVIKHKAYKKAMRRKMKREQGFFAL